MKGKKIAFWILLPFVTIISYLAAILCNIDLIVLQLIPLFLYTIIFWLAAKLKSKGKILLTVFISGYLLLPLTGIVSAIIDYNKGNTHLSLDLENCDEGMIDPKTRAYMHLSIIGSPFTTGIHNFTTRTLISFFGYAKNSYSGDLPSKEDLNAPTSEWTIIPIKTPGKVEFYYRGIYIVAPGDNFNTCIKFPTCDHFNEIEIKPFKDDILLIRKICSGKPALYPDMIYVYSISTGRILQRINPGAP